MGAAIGLFAIGYLVLAFQMPDYTAVSVPVQPSTLPRWLGVVLLILAVLLFFQRAPVDAEAAGAPVGPGSDGAADQPGAAGAATGTGAADQPGAAGAATGTGAADEPTAAGAADEHGDGSGAGVAEEGGAKDGAAADGGSAGPDSAPLGRFADPRLEIGLFVGALVAYVALFELLGFVLATALYLGSMTWYLGYRRHLVTVTVALGLPFALYAGMTWGLGVALPSGPLPF
jgi:putative tricarboxylic transport membrane protein